MSSGELMLYKGLKQFDLRLLERQSEANSRAGGGYVVDQGAPYWALTLRYEGLNEANWRALEGWVTRRRKSLVTFTAYSPQLQKPFAMPSADNSGLSMSVTSSGDVSVTKSSLILKAGDMLSFYTAAGGYYFGRALNDKTGSGTVEVIPKATAIHETTPDPKIVQALGEFQLVGERTSSDPYDKRRSMSLEARQVVRL